MIQRGHRLRSANSAPTAPPNREAVRVLGESVFFITRNLVIRADDTQVLWERNIVQLFPKTMMPLPRPSLHLATIFRFFPPPPSFIHLWCDRFRLAALFAAFGVCSSQRHLQAWRTYRTLWFPAWTGDTFQDTVFYILHHHWASWVIGRRRVRVGIRFNVCGGSCLCAPFLQLTIYSLMSSAGLPLCRTRA